MTIIWTLIPYIDHIYQPLYSTAYDSLPGRGHIQQQQYRFSSLDCYRGVQEE
jgi:hypothetical protein